MKRRLGIAITYLLLATVGFAEPDFAAVGVGDHNSLDIPGLLTLPAPSSDWAWEIGDKIEKSGVTVRVFFCRNPKTEQQYHLLVCSVPRPISGDKEKKEFISGLLEGTIEAARNQGFQISKSEIIPSSTPATGFYRYEYVLQKDVTSFYLFGFILVHKYTIALQCSGQDPDIQKEFVDFTKGLHLAANEQASSTPNTDVTSTRKEMAAFTMGRLIGRITGYVSIGILVVGFIMKAKRKK
jgi:hypothetical protein